MFDLLKVNKKAAVRRESGSTPASSSSKETLPTEELLHAERIYREGTVSIRDFIAPSSIRVQSDHLELGGLYLRTLFVVTYPRYISVGWFEPIIDYSATLDIGMFFYQLETEIILKQLRNKVGVLEAQLASDQEKGAPRDPVRETALRDIEKLRDDITQGTEHFFKVALYVTLYAPSLKELDKLTERIESMIGSKLVFSRRATWQAEQGFNSTLPLAVDELGVNFNMNTSPAAASFPFVSSELSSDQGVLYGINRHNNSLILFDRFSLPNANMVVFATSGAGKSYAIKLEVLRSLMFGTDIIIIDPEREYQYLAQAVGGTYINISLNSDSKINPFDLPHAIGGEAKAGDIIRSAVITLKGLIRIMIGELTHQEDSLLDRAILETYAKKDITASSDLTKVEPPVLSDLEDILKGMEGGDDIALRLKKYTEGTFAGLLNHPTNIDLDGE